MFEYYKSLMTEFLKFKSVSTDPAFQDDIKATVDWLKTIFKEKGFETQSIGGFGNPIFLTSLMIDSSLPTVLIYGHYDVQPASIEEGWDSEPFELTEKDGRIFARGAIDNKGQVGIHIATIFKLLEAKNLKYNVKFILEGDEESGSDHIEDFFNQHVDLLKADLVLMSDGELMMGHPIIDIGYRGVFNCTLKVKTSDKDNHSGVYGGSIPNAPNELAQLLAKMHKADGRLTIPGIDNDYVIDTAILENNKTVPFNLEEILNVTGAKKFIGENVVDFYTLTGYMSSAEITGMNSGYTQQGYKNAIPGAAFAKLNFRLAGNMTVAKAFEAFKTFIGDNKPEYIDYELILNDNNEPIVLDYKNEYINKAIELQKEIYGADTILLYNGAIIPIAGYFKNYLKIPVVSAGLGNEDCNMHGANENFKIEHIEKGLEFSRRFLSK